MVNNDVNILKIESKIILLEEIKKLLSIIEWKTKYFKKTKLNQNVSNYMWIIILLFTYLFIFYNILYSNNLYLYILIISILYIISNILFRFKNKNFVNDFISIELRKNFYNLYSLQNEELLEIISFLKKNLFFLDLNEKYIYLKIKVFNFENRNKEIKNDFLNNINLLLSNNELNNNKIEKIINDVSIDVYDWDSILDVISLLINNQLEYIKNHIDLNKDLNLKINENKKLLDKYKENILIKNKILELEEENNELEYMKTIIKKDLDLNKNKNE